MVVARTKKCNGCERELELTTKNFTRKASNKDGFAAMCKPCKNGCDRVSCANRRAQATIEEIIRLRAYNAKWNRDYRAKNKDYVNARDRKSRRRRSPVQFDERVRGGPAVFTDHGCMVQGLVAVR